MPTKIVHNSPKLCAFLDPLIESLSEPQRQHLRDLCDALLVCESEHTLAALQRQFVETTDASNWADFLRVSPWSAGRIRAELLEAQISFAIEQGQKSCQAREIYLNIDDSIGEKHRDTWRLEVVDIHHDHTRSTPKQPRYVNGFCYVVCTMRVGGVAVTLDFQFYLRNRTVRAINRTREADERVRIRSKNTIACEMLKRIAPHLPEGSRGGRAIRQLVRFEQDSQVCPPPEVAIYLRREVHSQARWSEPRHPSPGTKAQGLHPSRRGDCGGGGDLLRAFSRRAI